MSDINSTAIGIGLGLGIPWFICILYILRQWLCPDCCIIRKTTYVIPPVKTIVKDTLSKDCYMDFLQGKMSIALRNEMIGIHSKQQTKIKDFIEFAKEINKPRLIPFIKDPIHYPMSIV